MTIHSVIVGLFFLLVSAAVFFLAVHEYAVAAILAVACIPLAWLILTGYDSKKKEDL